MNSSSPVSGWLFGAPVVVTSVFLSSLGATWSVVVTGSGGLTSLRGLCHVFTLCGMGVVAGEGVGSPPMFDPGAPSCSTGAPPLTEFGGVGVNVIKFLS